MDSAQDTTDLRESYHPWEDPESQHARELRYVKNLEEVKAKILILEQMLADQPGSKDLQEKLVDARHWHKVWDEGLSAVQALRKSLLSRSLKRYVQNTRFLPLVVKKHLRRRYITGTAGIRTENACLATGKARTTKQAAVHHS